MANFKPVYLDYAAATPLDVSALQKAQQYFADSFYNPSAVYQSARKVRQALELARGQVASVLGSKDQEILFTAGGTEANNVAIQGVMNKFPNGNIVVSSIEHESVLEPASGYECRIAPVSSSGIVDLSALDSLIDENTVLVSVMYVNNEIGTIQPLKEVAKIIEQKKAARTNALPLYFHTDACQAANYLDLQVTRLGVDLMTLNGGKIYAMKQSGCLYIRAGVDLSSFVLGGGQENGIRSGTENVPAQIAFATMLQKVQENRKEEVARQQKMRDEIFAILSQNIPNLQLNGDAKKRVPNNLNLLVPGADGERLLMELDEAGVMVATGSACTASSDDPSHVLLAIGLNDQDASASIRITLGRTTTEEEITQAATQIVRVIEAHVKLV
jgi:cysteine desulfurase